MSNPSSPVTRLSLSLQRIFNLTLCFLLILPAGALPTPRGGALPTAYSPLPTASSLSTPSSFGFSDGSLLWIPNDTNSRAASVAWGDMDADGDLDLALAISTSFEYLEPGRSRVYENTGRGQFRLAWTSPQATKAVSIAWGDADSDGDLDLAVGNGYSPYWNNEPPQLYINQGGVQGGAPGDFAVRDLGPARPVSSIAWGDADGDGDFDLVAGGYNQTSQLYINQGGAQGGTPGDFVPQDLSALVRYTTSAAWGDADGDGDLDLALGNAQCGYALQWNIRGLVCLSGQIAQLYINQGGVQGGTPGQFVPQDLGPVSLTTSIAWSDSDGDGDLDLAVGRYGETNLLYVNQGGVQGGSAGVFTPQDIFTDTSYTTGLAWGDADNDGDLDLAASNNAPFDVPCWCQGKDINRIYYNQGGNTFAVQDIGVDVSDNLAPAWGDADGDGDLDLAVGGSIYRQVVNLFENQNPIRFTPEKIDAEATTTHVALGDYDGDGDLDLALGKTSHNQLYANDGFGHFTPGWTAPDAFGHFTPGWAVPATHESWSVEWGDADNDGDLDLVSTDWNQGSRIYFNNGDGSNFTIQDIISSSTDHLDATSAWGDVDGDGDLDLAVGTWNWGGNDLFYLNAGGLQPGSPGSFTEYPLASTWAMRSTSAAWGDYDNDGDLDLAIGHGTTTNDQYLHLYQNQNGTLQLIWQSPTGAAISGLSWGDYDADGDLDLAAARNFYNWIYENVDGQLLLDPAAGLGWQSPDMRDSASAAWGDMEGDGDLDLAVGKSNYPLQVYVNDGLGNLSIQDVTTTTFGLRHIAWGDMDADGDLDLVGVTNDNQTYLFRNRLYGSDLPGRLPVIHLTRPGRTPAASFYSAPDIISQTEVPITYTLRVAQPTTVRSIRAFYSPLGGGQWFPAVAADGVITSSLSATPEGEPYIFTWDTAASGFFGQSDNVLLRLEAIPSLAAGVITLTANTIPGPYLYGRSIAATASFRLRGIQVRVLQEGQPAAGAQVYRLPAGQLSGADLLADSAGQPFLTNSLGYLGGRAVLSAQDGGDGLVALLPITTTEKYTVYYTNAAPTAAGLDVDRVAASGVQTLTVSAAHPLTIFNLSLSLEWDASDDLIYLQQLQYDLRRAAELLYDWSNGQVTLGEITIYQQRQNWETADIQILSNNRYNPNADQGGVTTQTITETVVISDTPRAIVYEQGQLRQGATWNRYGESTGSLGEDWPRALAHELAHYLLYLDDNYYGFDDLGNFTAVSSCSGVMADPYSTDKPNGGDEFHSDLAWLPSCADTASQRSAARSDWATVTHFYPWLQAPAANFPGPAALPLNTVSFQITAPAARTPTASSSYFSLFKAEGGAYQASARSQGVLIQDERLMDLGGASLDQLLARGAQPGDRLCLFDLALDRLGCKQIAVNDNQQLDIALHPEWRPDITIHPVTSTTLQITLTVALTIPVAQLVYAQLYPTDSPVEAVQQFTPSGESGVLFSLTYPLSAPAPDATLHVWTGSGADQVDAVSSYSLGGNPVKKKKKPVKKKKKPAPVISSDGQVILHGEDLEFTEGEFYILQSAARPPAAPPWASMVGQAYRLDASPGAPSLAGTSLQFYYLRREVPPGEEGFLRVYYSNGGDWQPITSTLSLDGVAPYVVAPVQGAGLYVLMSSLDIPLEGVGWNLFSYPVDATRPVAEALLSISGYYTTVYGYDASDLANQWKVYNASVPSWVNDLHNLEFGHGYWIKLSQSVMLWLKGGSASRYPTPALPIAQSSDGEGENPTPPATFYGILPASLSPQAGQTLTAWIDGKVCGQALTFQEADKVVFVIKVFAEDDAAYTGCGFPGRTVTFQLEGQNLGLRLPWQTERLVELYAPPSVYTIYLPSVSR